MKTETATWTTTTLNEFRTAVQLFDSLNGNKEKPLRAAGYAMQNFVSRLEGADEAIRAFQANLTQNPDYAFRWSEDALRASQTVNVLSVLWAHTKSKMDKGELIHVAFRASLEKLVASWTEEMIENSRPLGTKGDLLEARREVLAQLIKDGREALAQLSK